MILGTGSRPGLVAGGYAGVVTRAAAFLIDVAIISVTFSLGATVVERLVGVFLGRDIALSNSRALSSAALAVWAFSYLAYQLATTGKTIGMAILGLRAVDVDGRDLSAPRAVGRVVVFPASFLLCGLGFVPLVLRRDHRALHDLLTGAAVVYVAAVPGGRAVRPTDDDRSP